MGRRFLYFILLLVVLLPTRSLPASEPFTVHPIRFKSGYPCKWTSYPIMVTISPDSSWELVDATLRATSKWEEETGLDLFSLRIDSVTYTVPNEVVVITGKVSEHDVEGVSRLAETLVISADDNQDELHSMVVRSLPGLGSDLLTVVLIHEFGHVLLMDHDEAPHSIMQAIMDEQAVGVLPMHSDYVKQNYAEVLKTK